MDTNPPTPSQAVSEPVAWQVSAAWGDGTRTWLACSEHDAKFYIAHPESNYVVRPLVPAPTTASASEPAHCQCPACIGGTIHASDCAVHNGPALPVGACDCGSPASVAGAGEALWRDPNFEREAAEFGGDFTIRSCGTTYADAQTHAMWCVWLAALATRPAADETAQAQSRAAAFCRGHDAGWASAMAEVASRPAAPEVGELQAEIERLQADLVNMRTAWNAAEEEFAEAAEASIPLSAIRPIAVEAIREVMGCPDVIGKTQRSLVEALESVAEAAAKKLGRTSPEVGEAPKALAEDQLLDEFMLAAGSRFFEAAGQQVAGNIRRDDLLQLIRAARDTAPQPAEVAQPLTEEREHFLGAHIDKEGIFHVTVMRKEADGTATVLLSDMAQSKTLIGQDLLFRFTDGGILPSAERGDGT